MSVHTFEITTTVVVVWGDNESPIVTDSNGWVHQNTPRNRALMKAKHALERALGTDDCPQDATIEVREL